MEQIKPISSKIGTFLLLIFGGHEILLRIIEKYYENILVLGKNRTILEKKYTTRANFFWTKINLLGSSNKSIKNRANNRVKRDYERLK